MTTAVKQAGITPSQLLVQLGQVAEGKAQSDVPCSGCDA
jgi:hypothetical protein